MTANACIDRVGADFSPSGRVGIVPVTEKLFAEASRLRHARAAPNIPAGVDGYPSRLIGCVVRRYGMGVSWEDCGRAAADFDIMTDGLHLNDRGAKVVAELIEKDAQKILKKKKCSFWGEIVPPKSHHAH